MITISYLLQGDTYYDLDSCLSDGDTLIDLLSDELLIVITKYEDDSLQFESFSEGSHWISRISKFIVLPQQSIYVCASDYTRLFKLFPYGGDDFCLSNYFCMPFHVSFPSLN